MRLDSLGPFFVHDSVADNGYTRYFGADSLLQHFRNYQLTTEPKAIHKTKTIRYMKLATFSLNVGSLSPRTLSGSVFQMMQHSSHPV
jgi:hypothetical protein